MNDNELKLYLTFPFWSFLLTGALILFSIYMIIFMDKTINDHFQSIFLIIISLFLLINCIVTNIFRKIGYIINKEGILFFSLYGKKMLLWDEIIGYNITGDEKSRDLFLNFQTEKTINNKNILKSKNAITISSKFYKIEMNELIDKINEIRGSNVA
jgi:hypothetical protein